MGAVAGFVALRGLDVAEGSHLLSRMLDALGERDPDDARHTAVSKDFGLAVKSPRGALRQPWRSPRGDFVVGWDGAPVLPEDAEGEDLGARLRHLHGQSEQALVSKIGGPFGLALWDGRTRTLLLGRDLFGQRSLMIAWSEDRSLFLFASEAKALLATRRIGPVLDGRAVLDLFSLGHPTGSLVHGVEPLPPGTWMTVNVLGQAQRGRAHPLPYPRKGDAGGRRAQSEQLSEGLDRALARTVSARAAVVVGEGPASALLARRLSEGRIVTPFVASASWDRTGAADFAEGLAGDLDVALASVPLTLPERADFVRCVHALETATLDVEPFFRAQIYAALRADERNAVVIPAGADALFGGSRVRATGFSVWGKLWRGTLSRWTLGDPELARAFRRGFALERLLHKRWGVAPARVDRWTMCASTADRVFARRFRPPSGPSRLPELRRSPLLFSRAVHRRDRMHQELVLSARDLLREERLASRSGVRPIAPFLAPEVSVLAPGGGSGTRLDLVRAALPARWARARRRGEYPWGRPHPTWPFGPGGPAWVREALSARNLDQLGLFERAPVEAMLARTRAPRFNVVSRLEVRVLTGILGLTLLAQSLGLTDVAWPTTPS